MAYLYNMYVRLEVYVYVCIYYIGTYILGEHIIHTASARAFARTDPPLNIA